MSSACCGPSAKKRHSKGFSLGVIFSDLRTFLTALCGLFLVLAVVSLALPRHGDFISRTLSLAAVIAGSIYAIEGAWESLKAKSLDVNLLMILAAAGAVFLGDFFEAAGLLFLFSLSGTLEAMAMSKTKSAIAELMKLRPDEALLIEGDEERLVPVRELKLGQSVRVAPFSALPVDGIVSRGSSSIDASAMTGESRPVNVAEGDRVLAGTQNLDGLLTIEVAAEVGDSTLDKIVALVEEAQENKASGERVSKWFGERYTVFVMVAFVVSLLIRLFWVKQTGYASVYDSLTLLVGMSPCALVISTPATTLSALAWAARNGILVRGGEFIEKAGLTSAIAFDKTGTLTVGKPQLVEVCVCSAPVSTGLEEDHCWMGHGAMSTEAMDVLAYAAAAERYANHPLAQAILSKAEEVKAPRWESDEATVVPGRGIRATVNSKRVLIGSIRLLEQYQLSVPEGMKERIGQMQGDGLTASFVAIDDHVVAFGFADQPRKEAKPALAKLRELGVKKLLLLSGDNQPTVDAVSAGLGIDSPRGGLLPHEKSDTITALAKQENVMMVGDGVNDAPSLAAATVGVAMGGLGSDVALNAADIVLMKDDLAMIPTLIQLGRKTNRIVKANLFFAAGVVICLTIGSLTGHLPLLAAVIGHEGSTVIVILVGLRLLAGP